MKKNLKYLIPTCILLIPILIYFLAVRKDKSKTPAFPGIGTPVSPAEENQVDYSNENSVPLSVVSVLPRDSELNVPTDSAITVTFNRNFKPNEIAFSLAPDTITKPEVTGNILIVTPLLPLQTGTRYTYIVKYASTNVPSRTYSFTTAGTPQALPDTRVEEAVKKENEFQLKNHPDVYLSNQMPYSTSSFTAEAEFLDSLQNPHFEFTVTVYKATGRSDFQSWVFSLGLNQTQLDKLSISYQ